jgi:hypothetical protein
MIWPQMRSIWFTSLLSIELSFLSSNIIISTISMSILPGPKLLWGFGLFNLKLVRPNHLWHESSEVDPLCPIGVGSQAALASFCEMDPVKINIAIKFDFGRHVFFTVIFTASKANHYGSIRQDPQLQFPRFDYLIKLYITQDIPESEIKLSYSSQLS